MARFRYTARDRRGRPTSGVVEATDPAELRKLLRSNELYMTRQKTVPESPTERRLAKGGPLVWRLTGHDLIVLLRQLATLLHAGVPVDQALSSLREQTDKPVLRAMLQDVLEGVVKGQPLATCLGRHPDIFEPVTLALIQTGETTGNIDAAIMLASDHLQRQDELNAKLSIATMYPKVVVSAAILAVIFMLTLVVPTFQSVYAGAHARLPAVTLSLIAISSFIVHYWIPLLLIVVASYFALRILGQNAEVRRWADKLKLNIPVAGQVLRKVSIAAVTNSLGSCLRAGVPVLQSLSVSADTAGNSIIRDSVIGATVHVREGALISAELDKSGEFPPMVISMIAAGEKTGELDHMLDEINGFYERDVSYAIERLVRLVEPVVTVVVGSLVLFILLALYSPIFGLGRAIRGY